MKFFANCASIGQPMSAPFCHNGRMKRLSSVIEMDEVGAFVAFAFLGGGARRRIFYFFRSMPRILHFAFWLLQIDFLPTLDHAGCVQ
jgi:hypothetical protein